jgi:hypothetical protein
MFGLPQRASVVDYRRRDRLDSSGSPERGRSCAPGRRGRRAGVVFCLTSRAESTVRFAARYRTSDESYRSLEWKVVGEEDVL